MTRTAGTSSSRYDYTGIINQSGSNYPSMVADIAGGGGSPRNVRYIHWTFNRGIKIEEVMCYEKKRAYSTQMNTSKSYLQGKNGAIQYTGCDEMPSGWTDINYNGMLKVWRAIFIMDEKPIGSEVDAATNSNGG